MDPTRWNFGPHTLSFEEPDLVRLRLHGELSLAEIRQMILLVREFKARQGAIYLLGDMRQGTGFSAEARRAIHEDHSLVPYEGMAFFGASFSLKVVSNLMIQASRLLTGSTRPAGAVFRDTEDEARAWIAARRAGPPP
jgi:hypothetical protein